MQAGHNASAVLVSSVAPQLWHVMKLIGLGSDPSVL
jgi:hypothetical protein